MKVWAVFRREGMMQISTFESLWRTKEAAEKEAALMFSRLDEKFRAVYDSWGIIAGTTFDVEELEVKE